MKIAYENSLCLAWVDPSIQTIVWNYVIMHSHNFHVSNNESNSI